MKLISLVSKGVWGLFLGVAACGGTESRLEGDRPKEAGESYGQGDQALTTSPAPEDVYVSGDIVSNGSGCPSWDRAVAAVSSDRKAFQVLFPASMGLEYPPGSTVQQRSCTTAIPIHVPQGWQVSIATVNTRGYVFLSPGQRARETSSYFFAGVPLSSSFRTELIGPKDENYTYSDEIPFSSVTWSPCGQEQIFSVTTQINLNTAGRPGPAIFNAESVDGRFQKVIGWSWRRCQ